MVKIQALLGATKEREVVDSLDRTRPGRTWNIEGEEQEDVKYFMKIK